MPVQWESGRPSIIVRNSSLTKAVGEVGLLAKAPAFSMLAPFCFTWEGGRYGY